MWVDKAEQSALKAIRKLAKTFQKHATGIINYIKHKVTNALQGAILYSITLELPSFSSTENLASFHTINKRTNHSKYSAQSYVLKPFNVFLPSTKISCSQAIKKASEATPPSPWCSTLCSNGLEAGSKTTNSWVSPAAVSY